MIPSNNWNLNLQIKIFLIFIALINPFTVSYLDPRPPLSALVYVLILVSYIILLALLLSTLFWGWTIFIIVSVTTSLLISIELVLRIVFPIETHLSFRLTRPEPYLNAKYFEEEFIHESFLQPGGYILDSKTGVVIPNDFQGKWFNISNGIRQTVGQPNNATRHIYIFGGSTVYNSEVPDALTIASQLQALLPKDKKIAVFNFSASSIHSAQQLARLKRDLILNRGDIVVFYDGVNDVEQRIVYENKKGYMFGKPENEGLIVQSLRRLSSISHIISLILRFTQDVERNYDINLINLAVDDYLNTLDEANSYVDSHGAYFFHFLQPNLFTKKYLNGYERKLITKGEPFVPKTSKSAFNNAYPLIKMRILNNVYSEDLTAVFDDLEISVYLDYCHTNEIGHNIIANRILKKIQNRL